MNTVICEDCGKEYGIGDSPYCRDGHLGGGRFGHSAFTPGNEEMISSEPVHFGNWGEKLRYMDKHGIEPAKLRERAYGHTLYFDRK